MGAIFDLAFLENLLVSMIRMATPLLLAGLGELYSEKAGMVNIGLDGHDDWRGRRVYRRLPDREPGFRSGRGGARRDFTEPDLRVFDDFAPYKYCSFPQSLQ